jgi:hypothetical protein
MGACCATNGQGDAQTINLKQVDTPVELKEQVSLLKL